MVRASSAWLSTSTHWPPDITASAGHSAGARLCFSRILGCNPADCTALASVCRDKSPGVSFHRKAATSLIGTSLPFSAASVAIRLARC